MKNLFISLFTITLLLGGSIQGARAQESCTNIWDPVEQRFVTVCGGSGGGNGGEDQPAPSSCTPGAYQSIISYVEAGDGMCEINDLIVDACTGEVIVAWLAGFGACPDAVAEGSNPCITFTITGGGVYCQTEWGMDWYLEANLGFPETFLDLRPYPATLVRWPTAARNGGQLAASGSGTLDYIAYGGGEEDDPHVGDWRDVKLTLSFTPAGPLFFSMPQLGTFGLPNVGETGQPMVFQWKLPSHPAAGGSVLASTISGLGELPGDIPLFAGSARSPYRLFWSLKYEKYVRDCEAGADPDTGLYQCKTKKSFEENNGHWEYEWKNRKMAGEITPQVVEELPAQLAADTNNDGIPDAYWNHNVTIRRMDEANSVVNPQWAASWNWGGGVYWAVREGQGQVGWP